MNNFLKLESFLIFVLILCEVFAKSKDKSRINFYGKRGKSHSKPNTSPTAPTQIELEPENPTEPTIWPEITHPDSEPSYTYPDNSWHPITHKPPKPESEWHPFTTTTNPEEEKTTTRRTPKPEPEWVYPTHQTTPRPWQEPERTTSIKTTTTPQPEPEWVYPTHRTTTRPWQEPERTTPTKTTTPEPEPPMTTTKRPYTEPEYTIPDRTSPRPKPPQNQVPLCQNNKLCPHGYRCGCSNPCPATCKNPNQKPCVTYGCKLECVCDMGYILNDNGTCIPLKECQRPQPPNGVVCNQLCINGKQCGCENPCPATCADPDPLPCPTLHCNPGCYTICKKGFVLDRIGGDCIPLQYCPNHQCITQPCNQRENEVYYQCSTRYCNRTCESPNLWCSSNQCIKPGNFDCKPNYVRDVRTGKCVLPQQCYEQILCDKRDELFYECGTRMCQKTCQRPNPNCAAVCLKPGNCDCRPGLVRDVKTCRCVDKNESSCLAQRISEN